ncbi:MAG: hypothetical protein KKC75_07380 [Nanoarchaeota archaeon]|nr:hypothetical protein [Nanoarchaeota archaeon]MBU1004534.1 hypothetical protein [Nanoarchaeota archaeon]MBU1945929.1 hypothetical protein [Nanoarchaeota archaeon]
MNRYITLVFLLLVFTACATQTKETTNTQITQPDQYIEEPQSIPNEPQPELPSPPKEQAPIEKQKNIIEINADSFSPITKTITKNTQITWINNDNREHKIACYLKGSRIITSTNLKKGDSFEFTFLGYGEYTCMDAIYGLRSTINVVLPSNMPTGMVVISSQTAILTAPLASIAILGIILLLFFIYGRRDY